MPSTPTMLSGVLSYTGRRECLHERMVSRISSLLSSSASVTMRLRGVSTCCTVMSSNSSAEWMRREASSSMPPSSPIDSMMS